jgi:cell division protein ZapA
MIATVNQHRFELELAGQKIPFATSLENETKLRAAAAVVNEQIEVATRSSGNRSIERAALIAALKIAGEVLDLRTIANHAANHAANNADQASIKESEVALLAERLNAIEKQIDIALETLSLPGAPRPIVP